MKRIERLNQWVETLDSETIKKILVECVDNLIDFEYVKFYEDNKSPFWDGNGERLDGKDDSNYLI